MTTDRSTAFDFAGSIEAAAAIVTEGTAFFTPEQLAVRLRSLSRGMRRDACA